MDNNEKIIKLLEEIRDTQKSNLAKAEEMQKKAQKRIFLPLLMFLLLILLISFLK